MSTEVAILKLLFPGGSIPVERIDDLSEIRNHIAALTALASGKRMPGRPSLRRLARPEDSQAATLRIVELWETPKEDGRPRTWVEVAAEVGMGISGNAARHRYETYKSQQGKELQKEAYAALSGEGIENSDHISATTNMIAASDVAVPAENGKSKENATVILPAAQPALLDGKPLQTDVTTVRNSRIVQESDEVTQKASTLTPSEVAKIRGPKIPHDWDEFILAERDGGKKFREIMETLQAKGIECRIDDVTARYQSEKKKRERGQNVEKRTSAPQNVAPVQQEVVPSPSQPGVEGAQDAARANPRGTPEEAKPAPEAAKPKLDYDQAVNAKIINMKKRGLLNHEIAQVLERNPGGRWDAQKVDARYTELKRQGLV
jgi:hypothetical protein